MTTPSPSTKWRDTLPSPNRMNPRQFGTSRFGVGQFSATDPTRYAWGRTSIAGSQTQAVHNGAWGY